jgi:Ran GTPase-activating protein (RanGAP) involved in mRNA processing and transport
VSTLCLRDCKLGAKGVRSITSLFTKTGICSSALKILDLSDNNLKSAGNQALAEWVKQETCPLEQLYLVNTGFDGELFFGSLEQNKESALSGLNISSNTLNKKALEALASLIENTNSLSVLSMCGVGLQKREFLKLFESFFNNTNEELRFLVDFSGNTGLGKCGKDIMDVMEKIKKKVGSTTDKLEALSLNDCALGSDGVIAFCTSLAGITISSLGLSKNVKDRLFGGDSLKKSGEAIAVFLTRTPSLSELSISGTGGYALKYGMEPILATLTDCKTVTVEHLDISGNKIGDKNMAKVAKFIRESSSLESIHLDGNDLGVEGLKKLKDAICESESLQYWTTPQNDIKALIQKMKQENARNLLQDSLHSIEAALEANQLRHMKDEEKKGLVPTHRMNKSIDAGRKRSASKLNGMSSVGISDSQRNARASLMFAQVQASPRAASRQASQGPG